MIDLSGVRDDPGTDTAANQFLLEATGITVRFNALVALSEVSIAVRHRKIVGLVGPNGAGKSTMFGVVSGLLAPNAGQVHFDGTNVTGLSAQARARLGMARTFQHPELFSRLTVREHVLLSDRIRYARSRLWRDLLTGAGFRRPGAAETMRVDALLERFGLTNIAERQVEGLPLGTSRLVEVARAMALDPKILLLDEPGSGLDMAERERLSLALRQLVAEHDTSLLFVEHDVEMVLNLSDFVYVLNFGTCIASGTSNEIRASEEVRSAYLGDVTTKGHR